LRAAWRHPKRFHNRTLLQGNRRQGLGRPVVDEKSHDVASWPSWRRCSPV
jgi:hypothetical protein